MIDIASDGVGRGVDLVSASGRSLEEIVTQVRGVASAIAQMAQSAREQVVSPKPARSLPQMRTAGTGGAAPKAAPASESWEAF